MTLEDLIPVLGGRIHLTAERRWLDTHVGGVRSFVVVRATRSGDVTFDLAVFTPQTRELDPFFSKGEGDEWWLGKEPVEVPRLKSGFVFTGCRRGVLFATSTKAASIESVVSALWELAQWAREPWSPIGGKSGLATYRRRMRRVRRDQLLIVGAVVLVVAFLLWWPSGSAW